MPNKKEIFLLALTGVAAGFFLTFYAASMFVILLFLCSLVLIKIFIRTESTDFLIKLFVISFILRALFCVVNYDVGLKQPFWGGDTQPDATVYNVNAFYVSHLLKADAEEENLARGKDPYLDNLLEKTRYYYRNELPPVGKYQFDSQVFLLGVFYAAFGYAPVAAKMMNSLFGCISIIVVYLISRRLFEEERPARIAAVIFAFFPSIFYWSVTGLRDSLANLLFLSYFLCLAGFITERKFKYILWVIPFVYLIDRFRPRVSTIMFTGIVTSLVLVYARVLWLRRKSVLRIFLLLGICFALFLFKGEISSKIVNAANSLAGINIQNIVSNGEKLPFYTNYRIYSDRVYQQEKLGAYDVFNFSYLVTIFKALLYFLFSPFLLGNWTLNFLPFYPQVIYWYIMVPFVVKGWLLFLKKDMSVAFALAALVCILILPPALYESNIGTAFRHKDMFIPIAFVFAAYAFAKWKVDNRYL